MSRRAALKVAGGLALGGTGGQGLPLASAQAPAIRQATASPGGAVPPVANPYAAAVNTGPSSRPCPAIGRTAAAPGTPYVIPTAAGWTSTALLTTGNVVTGHAMAGIPDGLGAFDTGDGTITVLMNQEIDAGHGGLRRHGGRGAFVSRWVIDKSTLEVTSGREFLDGPEKLNLWTNGQWVPASAGAGKRLDLDRLCSADLAPISAYYNAATGLGYDGHIFLNGEESERTANRAFAWVAAAGTAYELPAFAFGKLGDKNRPVPCWENLLGNPAAGNATVVAANSDGGPSEIYVYIGAKRATGSPIERAGLADGRLFSLLVDGVRSEDRLTNIGIAKSRLGQGAGKRFSLAQPYAGTSFLRPEDGAWDPQRTNVYYFATTDRNNFAADGSVRKGQNARQIGRSRLWAVTFDSIEAMATGGAPVGRIEMLLDGTEGGDMFDNITVDRAGIVYLCEDAGDSRHAGKIWAYDTNSGELSPIMQFDPTKFGIIVGRPRPTRRRAGVSCRSRNAPARPPAGPCCQAGTSRRRRTGRSRPGCRRSPCRRRTAVSGAGTCGRR